MLGSIRLCRFATSSFTQCRSYTYCIKGGGRSQAWRRIPSATHTELFTRPTLSYRPSVSLLSNHQTVARCADLASREYTLIYALPSITLLRALSKLKIIQTGITIVILPPIYYFYFQGMVSLELVDYSSAIALFAVAMLYTVSYFAGRVVGRMYLDSSGTTLKVSHLTFWGARKDLYMPVTDVVPLADAGDKPDEAILSFKRYSTEQKMYLSTRFGRVVDQNGFEKVFGVLS
ncbi:hypothetical protein ACEWY4_018003 [Coilia grayii]|uniref:Transmembrane protein 186 n=1 Tax=Coilia grayii TaxID=363190 RepID=A0ABD1JIG4_9TELE